MISSSLQILGLMRLGCEVKVHKQQHRQAKQDWYSDGQRFLFSRGMCLQFNSMKARESLISIATLKILLRIYYKGINLQKHQVHMTQCSDKSLQLSWMIFYICKTSAPLTVLVQTASRRWRACRSRRRTTDEHSSHVLELQST